MTVNTLNLDEIKLILVRFILHCSYKIETEVKFKHIGF